MARHNDCPDCGHWWPDHTWRGCPVTDPRTGGCPCRQTRGERPERDSEARSKLAGTQYQVHGQQASETYQGPKQSMIIDHYRNRLPAFKISDQGSEWIMT